jgi:hypothetical protein
LSNPNTEKLTVKNSPNEIHHPKLNTLNPSLNTLSVTIIINIIGNIIKPLLKKSRFIMLVLRILSSPRTMIVSKKYKTTKMDNFALKRRYIFLFIMLVKNLAKIHITKRNKLSFIFKIAIASQKSSGLYIPKIENQITCLNILITSVAIHKTRIIPIKSTGNQL